MSRLRPRLPAEGPSILVPVIGFEPIKPKHRFYRPTRLTIVAALAYMAALPSFDLGLPP